MSYSAAAVVVDPERCVVVAVRDVGRSVLRAVGGVGVRLQLGGRGRRLLGRAVLLHQVEVVQQEVDGADDGGHDGAVAEQRVLVLVVRGEQRAEAVADAEHGDDWQRLAGGEQPARDQVAHVQHERDEDQHQRHGLEGVREQRVPRRVHQRQPGEAQDVHGEGGDQDVRVPAVVDDQLGVPQQEEGRHCRHCDKQVLLVF